MLAEAEKISGTKVLCEHVSQVFGVRDKEDINFAIFNALTYVVIVNVNVFCLLFLNQIWSDFFFSIYSPLWYTICM